jgi:protein-S-isoprenylcysteine O-methyltransferase Ste14
MNPHGIPPDKFIRLLEKDVTAGPMVAVPYVDLVFLGVILIFQDISSWMEEVDSKTIAKRIKNLVGAGPQLLLMGLLLEGSAAIVRRWISFPISITVKTQAVLTIPCVAVCLLGMIWFNHSLNLIKVNLLDGENKLVTHGPFNYVRHPLYSTLLITIPPLMIIWFSDLLFIIPWFLMLILSHFFVSLEERGLIETFGDDYERYRRHVPALLPLKGAGGRRFREHR